MRPIDADALVAKMKALDIWHETEYQEGYFDGFSDGIAEVEEAPTIEAEPVKHGRWIKPTKINGRSFNIVHCSVCVGVPCGVDENTRYCPNCGAKMDLEETWLM